MLAIELVLLGDSFSGSAVVTSLGVAAGGTLGVAYGQLVHMLGALLVGESSKPSEAYDGRSTR